MTGKVLRRPEARPVQRPWDGCPRIHPKGLSDPGKARSVTAPQDPPMPHRIKTPLGQKAGRNPHRDLPLMCRLAFVPVPPRVEHAAQRVFHRP